MQNEPSVTHDLLGSPNGCKGALVQHLCHGEPFPGISQDLLGRQRVHTGRSGRRIHSEGLGRGGAGRNGNEKVETRKTVTGQQLPSGSDIRGGLGLEGRERQA
eukprot:3840759-Rhodomonas_salina.3